ncbi:efflux transporter outer membrane subunit [Ideonella sp. BN130291]|uniref:efflux transporter outer membrane subunit n=1 Tax=Ideonella sp. BN130291 TaxID=3112940 RepID=UPI002E2577B7|nr:efflux transporter outer membrane subunit [Ideonella sp. BN130291]
MTARLLSVACAAALAGCMSLAPTYERPAAPVAAQFPFADAAAGGTPAAQREWQAFFADARLQRLISTALSNNRDLRVAVLNIEAARAQAGVRRADEWPTVNLAAGATRQPAANGSISTTYTAGFAVAAFELDLFGRVRSLSNAALAQLAASEEARKAAQIALVASVANLYYAIAGDYELIQLTERTLATREESLRLTRLRFDNGVISELDLQLAQSLVEAARVALVQQRRQRALDQNALELLLGQPLPAGLPPAAAWSATSLPDLPAGLPSEVLLQRPDVRQAEQQLIAANANIGAARAAFWPRISLTGSIGTASNELSGLFHGTAWTFAPQLLMPLFDAGRNRANLQGSEAARDIAVAQYERAIQAAFRDVADALAGRATLQEQLRAQQAQADAEAVRYRLSTLRFENGVASSLELLDAQRSLFAAQQAVLQSQLALIQNRVAVYRSLGGGWAAAGSAPAR